MSTFVNNHAPLRKMNKKEVKFCEKPWITPKIQKLMKYRDKLLKKLNRKFTLMVEYLHKKFRNRVVNEIKSSKVKYCNSYFTEHQPNMEMLWSGIRSVINIKGKKFFNISQIVNNGEIVQNPKEIAKIFNNYSVNIAGKVDSEIPRTRKNPLDYLGKKLDASFFSFSNRFI